MKGNMLKELAMRAKNRMMNKVSAKGFEARIRVISEDDSAFVEKVRTILENEENSRNPLKILMDDKHMNKLDPSAKERYLLETIDKSKETIEKTRFAG